MIEPNSSSLSIQTQCELLDLPSSTYYYESTYDNTFDLKLMRMMDEEYTRHPFYGVRRIANWFKEYHSEVGPVNHKKVARLMQIMGLKGITPKRSTSKPNKSHITYPYLLRKLPILYPNLDFLP